MVKKTWLSEALDLPDILKPVQHGRRKAKTD
jgi:hypothetical protein